MIFVLKLDMEKINSYSPDPKIIKTLAKISPLLLVGPAGAGKDTIKRQLISSSDSYAPIVTYTTRKPRNNNGRMEIDGVDYHFISEARAIELMNDKKFIELAVKHGNLYGSGLDEMLQYLDGGIMPVIDIDIQGVERYKKYFPLSIAIFLLPPNFKVMKSRLLQRYGHSEINSEIVTRFNTTLIELETLVADDFYYPIINDDLTTTTEEIKKVLSTKSHNLTFEKQAYDLAHAMIEDIKVELESLEQ